MRFKTSAGGQATLSRADQAMSSQSVCHSERREESIGKCFPATRWERRRGSFAALRMTFRKIYLDQNSPVIPAVKVLPRLFAIWKLLHDGAPSITRSRIFCAFVRLRPETKSFAQRVRLYSMLKSYIVYGG